MISKFIPENDDYYNIFAYARFIRYFKFLAYSNEVGESVRHTFQKLIIPAYCLSFGYIFADMYHHCYPFYHDNGWSDKTKYKIRNIEIFHSTASLLFPTIAIGGTMKALKFILIKNKVNTKNIRWTLPLVGVGMIPLIIKPIDDFTEEKIMPYFEKKEFNKKE